MKYILMILLLTSCLGQWPKLCINPYTGKIIKKGGIYDKRPEMGKKGGHQLPYFVNN